MNSADERGYWLGLFNHSTWQTFLAHGSKVIGFKETRWSSVQKIQIGDYILCYLTGVSRWIGALAVTDKPFLDATPIWEEDPLPARVAVKPVVMLTAETAVPITELREQLSLFENLSNPKAWTARLRRAPVRWSQHDGEAILDALLDAEVNPVVREIKAQQLSRRRGLPESKPSTFTVAEAEPERYPINLSGFREPATHSEIQWLLLKIGNDLGLDVWVARNDRSRSYAGARFSDLPRLLNQLPRQFDPAAMQTVELIDVLWLQGGALLAAFEIESTTSIYSGLLRMSDLLAMQPNLNLDLYLVAPEERRQKVFFEINRPTFNRLSPPLNTLCRFISFSRLRLKIQEAYPMLPYLKPEFIKEIAESCQPSQ